MSLRSEHCLTLLSFFFSGQDSFGNGDANTSLRSSNPENGFSDLSQSEKAVQELLTQQTPMQATDDHLIEFSEALRSKLIKLSSVYFPQIKKNKKASCFLCR